MEDTLAVLPMKNSLEYTNVFRKPGKYLYPAGGVLSEQMQLQQNKNYSQQETASLKEAVSLSTV